MIDVKQEGPRLSIDVRENIRNGEHPKAEIFRYVKEAPVGTVIEIHVPHKAGPLISGLESFGLNVVTHELAWDHYLIRTVKLEEI